MKKSVTITTLFISCISIGIAQKNSNETDFREDLRFGIKAGINYSNVYDAKGESLNVDPKFGLVAGGFLAIPIGKYLGVQPELLYSQKGFKASGVLLGSTYTFTRTTSYIDIPLQVALKPSEFVTLLLGPQYSYLIKQKDVFANSTTSYAQEQEFNQDNIRKNMFGIAGGFDINLKQITMGGRLGWDISKNNGDGTSSTPRYKNKWYQITMGYCF